MTTPKQGSRWSSLLQQAVAGVENRLDNILADGSEDTSAPRTPNKSIPSTSTRITSVSVNTNSRNTPATSRTNDRLQERLAKVIATKNVGSKGENSSSVPSKPSSPITLPSTPRISLESSLIDSVENIPSINPEPTIGSFKEGHENEGLSNTSQNLLSNDLENDERKVSGDSTRSSTTGHSVPSTSTNPHPHPPSKQTSPGTLGKTPQEYGDLIVKLQSDILATESQREKDNFDNLERIDALESKLRYLTKESVDNARAAGASALKGSLEKKLADKELQVALLLQEGQSLSKKEIDHLAIIKKLRLKVNEDTKELAVLRKSLEATKLDASLSMEKLKKLQSFEKQAGENQKSIARHQQEFKSLQSEIQTKNATIDELKGLLKESKLKEDMEILTSKNESLETEKERVAVLEAEISKLKSDKRNYAEKTEKEIQALQEAIAKSEERAKTVSFESKAELQIMEGKLEVMRARLEEASSGANGDAQIKLLRQIETLQTQYSIASDNWQSIEASLTSRAMNLEKDKEEANRKEAEARRRAREATLKAKSLEEEAKDLRIKLSACQQELFECKSQLQALKKQLEEVELTLHEARTEFELEKETWKRDKKYRLDEEKQKWQEEISSFNSAICHPVDAALTSSKSPTSENIGSLNHQLRRTLTRSFLNNESSSIPLAGRRSSSQIISRTSGSGFMTRQDSINSPKEDTETDFAQTDHDFPENGIESNFSYRSYSDLTSVPTENAGPSVQLVERMSSAVRRLECEKVATKEDIMRISKQRDEARVEIVSLLKELEMKKEIEEKFNEVREEMAKVEERYETTLVMLGEKSEEVEELRGDIEDIKSMYRELVERTVK